MDRSFLLFDAPLRVLCAWLSVLSDDGDTLDDGALLVDEDLEYTTRLALVYATEDDDLVALLDM